MHIELLRHGETSRGRCYLGRTDAALTERGRQQMWQGLVQRSPEDYDAIISSPLIRCLAFARDWAGSDRLTVEPRLAEYDFGDWDGLTGELLYARDPQALERFWQDPWRHPPPGAESMDGFFDRLKSVLDDLRHRHSGRVLLICHGGVICVMRCLILRLPREQLFEQMPEHGSLHSFGLIEH
nr:histidine phosphatase family protein [Marinobacterium ramblicola]